MILVTGGNGQLGSTLKELAPEFIYTDVKELDITKIEDIDAFVKQNKITAIINCAAYTAVDKAEDEKDIAELINAKAVENIATIANKHKIYVVHVSTDYVFDGKGNSPVSEDHDTNPLSVYGETKLQGELALQDSLDNFSIVRTSWLYSPFGNNFVKSMIKYGTERDELKIVIDQTGTPTYCFDLADALIKLTQKQPQGKNTYHFSNEGVTSWFDFTQAIISEKKIDCQISPIYSSEYPTKATRPMYSVLSKNKIKNELNITIPHWQESLKKCLAKIS